jgi:hypothetical protein
MREKARQFRSIAASSEGGLSAKLFEVADELEAYAKKLEGTAAGFAARPRVEAAQRLQKQAADLLRQAVARADAGDWIATTKLVEFAAEIQTGADNLHANPKVMTSERLRRIQQLRLRAEETRTIADSLSTSASKTTMIHAAETYERAAASLERMKV